jgi:hypothetical protein
MIATTEKAEVCICTLEGKHNGFVYTCAGTDSQRNRTKTLNNGGGEGAMGERSCSSQTKSSDLRNRIFKEVCVIVGVNSDMVVQERNRPCNIQLQAEVACSRARGGENAQKSLNRREEGQ